MSNSTDAHFVALGATTYKNLAPLPSVANDISVIKKWLQRFGFKEALPEIIQANDSSAAQHLLNAWLSSPDRTPDTILTVYYSGHGISNEAGKYYLALPDTDPSRLSSTALSLSALAELIADSVLQDVLIILDACGAAEGATEAASQKVLQKSVPSYQKGVTKSLHFISATKAGAVARQGVFSSALEQVLTSVTSTGYYPSGTRAAESPYLSLQAIVEEMNGLSKQTIVYDATGITELPRFFPNITIHSAAAALRARGVVEPYGDFFSHLINDTTSRVCLHARNVWRGQRKGGHSDVHFELTSGAFTKKFITVWELFSNRYSLGLVEHALADLCQAHYERKKFDILVTCTSTANEIGRYVAAEVRNRISRRLPHLQVEYPATIATLSSIASPFIGTKAIIVTDVVVTGTLLLDLIGVLKHFEIEVNAIATIVLANPAQTKGRPAQEVWFPFGHGPEPGVPLNFVVCADLEVTDESAVDKHRTIRIDHRTILPASDDRIPANFEPLIELNEALRHLDSACVLRVGFCEIDERPSYLWIDVKSLLRSSVVPIIHGIIEKEADAIFLSDPRETVVVTTYKQSDLFFKYTLDEWLSKKYQATFSSTYIIKRSTRDSAEMVSNFLSAELPTRGKHIVVVLGTCSTSEKLRAIVGMLSTLEAKSVTVLSLISRLGFYTSEFFHWVGEMTRNSELSFRFKSVYAFHELNQDKLARALTAIQNYLLSFERFSKVPAFKLHSNILRRAFTPAAISDDADISDHNNCAQVDSNELGRTLVQNICRSLCDYANGGDFRSLEFLMAQAIDSKINRIIIGIVASEPTASHGAVGSKILESWLQKLKSCRESRLRAEHVLGEGALAHYLAIEETEDARLSETIATTIATEVVLLEAIVLLTPFIQGHQLPPAAQLFGFDLARSDAPLNSIHAMANADFYSLCSLYVFLRAGRHSERTEEYSRPLLNDLIRSKTTLGAIQKTIGHDFDVVIQDAFERIRALEFDLSQRKAVLPITAINHLQDVLLSDSDAEKELLGALAEPLEIESNSGEALIAYPWQKLGSVQRAMWSFVELVRISDSAGCFMSFYAPARQRFFGEEFEFSLKGDLNHLDQLLRSSIFDGHITSARLYAGSKAIERIRRDLFIPDSDLILALKENVSEVSSAVESAIEYAATASKQTSPLNALKDAWRDYVMANSAISRMRVVAPRNLLRDIVGNILLNLRFQELATGFGAQANVECSRITTTSEEGNTEFCLLRIRGRYIETSLDNCGGASVTVRDINRRLFPYGGRLDQQHLGHEETLFCVYLRLCGDLVLVN